MSFLTVLCLYFEAQGGTRGTLRGVCGSFCRCAELRGTQFCPEVLAKSYAADLVPLRAVTSEKQCSSSKTKFTFFSSPPVKGVLLLQQLTRSNAAIQKIVAFENAFERLLDIITEEGNSDGGTEKSKV